MQLARCKGGLAVAELMLARLSSLDDLGHRHAVLLPDVQRVVQELEGFFCLRCVIPSPPQALNDQFLAANPVVSLSNMPVGGCQVIVFLL